MVVIIHVCPTSNVFLELFSNVILSSWLAVPQIQEDFTLRITGWNSSEDNNSNERIWINGKRVGLVAADSSGAEKGRILGKHVVPILVRFFETLKLSRSRLWRNMTFQIAWETLIEQCRHTHSVLHFKIRQLAFRKISWVANLRKSRSHFLTHTH